MALLATGTAVGQVISFALMPIITRLYTPADYGVFGVFTALVTILGSVVGLKFEAAILLPPRTRRGGRKSCMVCFDCLYSARLPFR